MFVPIKDLLPKSIKNAGIEKQVEAAMIIEKFHQILQEMFGRKAVGRARAVYFKNGILTISSTSSVLIQEIYLKQKQIIKKINEKFGKIIVNNFKFRM